MTSTAQSTGSLTAAPSHVELESQFGDRGRRRRPRFFENSADALTAHGLIQAYLGKAESATASLDRAMQLNPVLSAAYLALVGYATLSQGAAHTGSPVTLSMDNAVCCVSNACP